MERKAWFGAGGRERMAREKEEVEEKEVERRVGLVERLVCWVGVVGLGALAVPPAWLSVAWSRGHLQLGKTSVGLVVGNRMADNNKPSATAEFVMGARAVGNWLGWCKDTLAWEFLELDAKVLVAFVVLVRKSLGSLANRLVATPAYLCARCVEFDEFVIAARARQVVVLGAGYDSRAYRVPLGPGTLVFEVDAPASQAHKLHVVQRAFQRSRSLFTEPTYEQNRVVFVPCDFAKENFMDKLVARGFDPQNPSTVFVMEGVASYLTWPQLVDTLKCVTTRCAAGAKFGMNVLFTETIADANFAGTVANLGEQWKFGLTPTESVQGRFGPLGFTILRNVTFVESVAERLGPRLGNMVAHSKVVKGRVLFMEVAA